MEKILAIFSKNCVLMGDLDAYCLVCYIPLTGDVQEHIRCPEHNAKLKQTVYFEKYKNDFIKKVNRVYFCEVCNKTFFTAIKVGIHVTEETHIKRLRRQLTRVGTAAVFQKDTLIKERAWNGIVEDTCAVCNVDIENHSTHMSELSHALHVVRSTVIVDDDNNIYRKVDGGYQCLTCNKVVSNTEISKHLDSEQHKAARVSLACTRNGADNNSIDLRNEEKKEQTKENKASIDDTKATSSKNVDTVVLSENSPGTEGKAINNTTAVTKELEIYGNKHGLFLTQDNFNFNCPVCCTIVPGRVNNVKQHTTGKKHKENMKLQTQTERELSKMQMDKVPSKEYLRQTLIVDNELGKYIIINESFCVEIPYFFLLWDVGLISICHICQTEIPSENTSIHLSTPSHEFNLRNAFVITSLKDEFVRQINFLFQCGFCGIFQKDILSMLKHLSSPLHEQQKGRKKMIFQRLKEADLLNPSTTIPINIFDRSTKVNQV